MVRSTKWKGLNSESAKSFYDNFGARQDKQAFYEDKALAHLIAHSQFGSAGSVFEFGCGTGRFAEILFRHHFPDWLHYTGSDLSVTMLELSKKRLAPFSDRVTLTTPRDNPLESYANHCFDRFVTNYVLDLLSDADIQRTLTQAHRLLTANGLLCMTSITHGKGLITRAVSLGWQLLFSLNASWVGGCRPIRILTHLDPAGWNVVHHHVVSQFGISSEVLVASPRP